VIPSPSTDARPHADEASASAPTLLGVLFGTLVLVAVEAFVLHPLGIRTAPRLNSERLLLAAGIAGWIGCCGVAAALFARSGWTCRLSSPFALGWLLFACVAVVLAAGRDAASLSLCVTAAFGGAAAVLIAERSLLLAPMAWTTSFAWRSWDVDHELGMAVTGAYVVGIAGSWIVLARSPRAFRRLNAVALLSAIAIDGVFSAPQWPAVGLGIATAVVCRQRGGFVLAFAAALLVACTLLPLDRPIDAVLTGAILAGWTLAIGSPLANAASPGRRPRWPLAAGGDADYGGVDLRAPHRLASSPPPAAAGRGFHYSTKEGGELAIFSPLALLLAPALALLLPLGGVVILGIGCALLWRKPDAETLAPDDSVPRRRLVVAFMLLAATARLVFWFSTDRVWEDGLITLRHAENAAQGLGLTHHPAHGRVHGFTSPLNVLIPLVGELVHSGLGLPLFRIATILSAAAAVWFAGRIAALRRLSTPATIFWLSMLALDHSQISYGIAGMESQLWTTVLLGGAWCVVERRWNSLGVLLMLAGLSRPEGCLWIALGVAAAFHAAGMKTALRVLLIAAAGLVPWLALTTWYYGSPVPHTMVAKSQGYHWGREIVGAIHDHSLRDLMDRLLDGLSSNVLPYLGPHFTGTGYLLVPTSLLPDETRRVALFFTAWGVVLLALGPLWIVSAFLVGVTVYLIVIVQIIFPWYPVPLLALAGLATAVGVDRWTGVFPRGWGGPLRWLVCLLLTLAYVSPLPKTFATEAVFQRLIEEGVRREVGLWLAENSDLMDTVAVECLGYVGYYSRLPIHDYPGLSSPRATAALKKAGVDRFLWPIVDELKPRWIVLRRSELVVPPEYEIVRHVRAAEGYERLLARHFPVQTSDGEFFILKRRNEAKQAPPDATPSR
jgi:hypothetical protein